MSNTRDAGIAQADVHVIYQATSQAVLRRGGIAGVTGGGGFPANTILVRTTGQTGPVVRQITSVIHETDPERPVDNVITLGELMREDIAPQRLNATLFSTFAVLALLVAAVGVLGVLAFSVTQRTKEFGVRLPCDRPKLRTRKSCKCWETQSETTAILPACATGSPTVNRAGS